MPWHYKPYSETTYTAEFICPYCGETLADPSVELEYSDTTTGIGTQAYGDWAWELMQHHLGDCEYADDK
jgi:hypothetical protein